MSPEALVGVLAVVGLWLRWIVATGSSIWTDEAEFLAIVRLPTWLDLITFLRLHESHPPLFYLLERVWLTMWGDSVRTALLLPVLLGVALIPAVYLAGRCMLSRWTAMSAAVLVTVNPSLVHFSGYARPYSLMPLLATVSTSLLWRALGGGGIGWWTVYTLSAAGMLLTHNWGWLVFGAQCAVVPCWFLGRRDQAAAARGWLAAVGGTLVLYAAWLPSFLVQLRHAGHAGRPIWRLDAPLGPFTEFGRVALGIPPTLSLAIVVVLVAAGIRSAWASRDDGQRLALLLCAGVPLVSVTVAGALSARTWLTPEYCLLITSPLALLAGARGLERFADRGNRVPFLVSAMTLGMIYALTWSGQATFGKSNSEPLARALQRASVPSDLIVIQPGFVAPALNYYFSARNEQIDYPFQQRLEAIPYDHVVERVADPASVEVTRKRLTDAWKAGRRVWFVTRCDWYRYPRVLPSDWLGKGLITADVPLMVTRFYQVRDFLAELYGPPIPHAIPMDPGARRETLCAELYRPGTK
jgi:mannosyltransferase